MLPVRTLQGTVQCQRPPPISLPLGASRSGLPIGVQLIGRLAEDELLLNLSAWLEEEMPREGRALSLRRPLLTGNAK